MNKKTFVAIGEHDMLESCNIAMMGLMRSNYTWVAERLVECFRKCSSSGEISFMFDYEDREYRFYLDGYDSWRVSQITSLLTALKMKDFTVDYIEE